jgi:hypothetical protein
LQNTTVRFGLCSISSAATAGGLLAFDIRKTSADLRLIDVCGYVTSIGSRKVGARHPPIASDRSRKNNSV